MVARHGRRQQLFAVPLPPRAAQPQSTSHDFYSTMKINRNRQIPLQNRGKHHFYSTIIWRGPDRLKGKSVGLAGPRTECPCLRASATATVQRKSRLTSLPSASTADFYSTMTPSRKRYMCMKTNDRCHTYSTMVPGGNAPGAAPFAPKGARLAFQFHRAFPRRHTHEKPLPRSSGCNRKIPHF